MKNKVMIFIMSLLLLAVGILWIQKNRAKNQVLQAQQEWKKSTISQDSLVKLSDGYYQKLVADTLTASQLKKAVAEIVSLKGRKPVSLTTITATPKYAEKQVDGVLVKKDSIIIEDYYPNKTNPFLKYYSKISTKTEKGISKFKFNSVKLTQVVTKKENGIYQIDFIAPDFLEVESIDIQAEPMESKKEDNWGTLLGVEYGKNLETKKDIFGISVYKRYKKIYIGAGVDSDKTVKGGLKIEL